MSQPFIVVGETSRHGRAVVRSAPTTQRSTTRRINDTITPRPHGGSAIVCGDSTVIIGGQPVGRHGDSRHRSDPDQASSISRR